MLYLIYSIVIRVRPKFFDKARHETMAAETMYVLMDALLTTTMYLINTSTSFEQ